MEIEETLKRWVNPNMKCSLTNLLEFIFILKWNL